MSKLLQGTSSVSNYTNKDDLNERLAEAVKIIENTGEPFFEPLVLTE